NLNCRKDNIMCSWSGKRNVSCVGPPYNFGVQANNLRETMQSVHHPRCITANDVDHIIHDAEVKAMQTSTYQRVDGQVNVSIFARAARIRVQSQCSQYIHNVGPSEQRKHIHTTVGCTNANMLPCSKHCSLSKAPHPPKWLSVQ